MGIELFFIAVGLSMDAFAVSVCKGLSTQGNCRKTSKNNWKGCRIKTQILILPGSYDPGKKFIHIIMQKILPTLYKTHHYVI